MLRSRGLGWLGLLAVRLGIGAALAATPGVASADPSTDPFSWIGGMDLGDLSVPAQTSALDMQVSIGGIDLFPLAGNTAIAIAGPGDIAIAIGNGAGADAGEVGTGFDFAFADGTSNVVEADGGIFDFASAVGNNDYVKAGLDGSFDFASIVGNNDEAFAGSVGSFDLATVMGDMLSAFASDGSGLVVITP